jgi:hypothetical protein
VKLHGDIIDNLKQAILSAARLRGHKVHPDTLQFWHELLSYARQERRRLDHEVSVVLDALIEKLETELAERQAH